MKIIMAIFVLFCGAFLANVIVSEVILAEESAAVVGEGSPVAEDKDYTVPILVVGTLGLVLAAMLITGYLRQRRVMTECQHGLENAFGLPRGKLGSSEPELPFDFTMEEVSKEVVTNKDGEHRVPDVLDDGSGEDNPAAVNPEWVKGVDPERMEISIEIPLNGGLGGSEVHPGNCTPTRNGILDLGASAENQEERAEERPIAQEPPPVPGSEVASEDEKNRPGACGDSGESGGA